MISTYFECCKFKDFVTLGDFDFKNSSFEQNLIELNDFHIINYVVLLLINELLDYVVTVKKVFVLATRINCATQKFSVASGMVTIKF